MTDWTKTCNTIPLCIVHITKECASLCIVNALVRVMEFKRVGWMLTRAFSLFSGDLCHEFLSRSSVQVGP